MSASLQLWAQRTEPGYVLIRARALCGAFALEGTGTVSHEQLLRFATLLTTLGDSPLATPHIEGTHRGDTDAGVLTIDCFLLDSEGRIGLALEASTTSMHHKADEQVTRAVIAAEPLSITTFGRHLRELLLGTRESAVLHGAA